MNTYDVVVLGTGGVGSAALFSLARRGARVLGLDRFAPGHDRGSSHGQTRIIRQAYFEHPDYVPLLLQAYQLWHELEALSGEPLLFPVGLLQVGPPSGAVLSGVRASAQQHGLAVEQLDARAIADRWPGLRVSTENEGLFEPAAGYLRVEACVQAHLGQAVSLGAALRTGVEVHGWTAEPRCLRVQTSLGEIETERLIITAGPWAPRLLAGLGIPFTVLRKPTFWCAPKSRVYQAQSGCPCFLFETARGTFYGMPEIDECGVKVAQHTGGQLVDDPLAVERSVDAVDVADVERFIEAHLPELTPRRLSHAVCMYTMSPDEHFVVDRLPEDPRVVFAAGLSGHGFKFTGVLGDALAKLALEGELPHEMKFLQLSRFSPAPASPLPPE